jgi:hypothetical protein
VWHQLLDAVLPDDPGADPLRGGGVQIARWPSCSGCRLGTAASEAGHHALVKGPRAEEDQFYRLPATDGLAG